MRLSKFVVEAQDSGPGDFRTCGCDACADKSALSEGPRATAVNEGIAPEGEVTVGGFYTGEIDPAGEVDFIALDVVAGQTYVISLSGTGDTPLSDTVLTVSDNTGDVIGVDDDGGAGTGSLFTFTATTTGEYILTAAGFNTGVGDYIINVRQQTDSDVRGNFNTNATVTVGETKFGFIEESGDRDMYRIELVEGQFYTFELAGGADYESDFSDLPEGELDTILVLYDGEGNEVARSDDISFPSDISSGLSFQATSTGTYFVRAEAYEGQTGGYTIDVETFDLADLDPLDSIDWGTQTSSNTIKVYFAPEGDVVAGSTSLGWSAYEQQQAMLALEQFENVADLSFEITTSKRQADFKLVTVESDQFLGRFSPPGEPNEGVGVFAVNGFGWEDFEGGGLEQGGYGFITLIHEFGHGLGLAHPHDTGGTSEVMFGVESAFGDYGVFDLNQGIYTTMSYNDGWQLHPDAVGGFPPGDPTEWGYQGTMMAFDVALLQEKYGANTTFGAGNTVYTLPTSNESGSYWTSIWDSGGKDSIVHSGALAAVIDLRPATIDYTATGGGLISWADGVFGGFTITAGTVIENATGGSGADQLRGNEAKNELRGGVGDDTLQGGAGADKLFGGADADTFVFDDGDSLAGKPNRDVITNFLAGTDIIDVSGIDGVDGGGDSAFVFIDDDAFTAAGQLRAFVNGDGDTVIQGSTDADAAAEFELVLKGEHTLSDASFVL